MAIAEKMSLSKFQGRGGAKQEKRAFVVSYQHVMATKEEVLLLEVESFLLKMALQ